MGTGGLNHPAVGTRLRHRPLELVRGIGLNNGLHDRYAQRWLEAIPPTMTDIPDGFAVHTRTSPATQGWEPLYARLTGGTFQLGIRIGAHHCNSRGMLHGGVIATLADNASGLTLGVALGGAPQGIVTTALAIDYIAAAKPGQWLQVEPRVIKASTGSGVIDALITADGAVVARANASFRVLG
jgi:uncharacterized protein (TIGR00369 family)